MPRPPEHARSRHAWLRRSAALLGATLPPLLGAGGCATLERGTTDRLAVVSDPAGATASLAGGANCVTPCSLQLGRSDEAAVTISKPGFAPRTVAVRTRVSDTGVGFFMENVVTAGVGGGVDLATGALLEHAPNPVSVTLSPTASPSPPSRRRSSG